MLLVPASAVHVAAASLWAGGIACLLLAVPAGIAPLRGGARSELLAEVAARFSAVALIAVVALALTGLIQGVALVGRIDALATTGYGRLVLLKGALLCVLALAGAAHRARTLPALRAAAQRRRAAGTCRRRVPASARGRGRGARRGVRGHGGPRGDHARRRAAGRHDGHRTRDARPVRRDGRRASRATGRQPADDHPARRRPGPGADRGQRAPAPSGARSRPPARAAGGAGALLGLRRPAARPRHMGVDDRRRGVAAGARFRCACARRAGRAWPIAAGTASRRGVVSRAVRARLRDKTS